MRAAHFTTRALFEYLQMREAATVPEIANRLKVPTPTVTGILSRLVKKGLVGRSEPIAGRRGRPRITYRLRLPGVVAACHWDGTLLAGGLFDADLNALAVQAIDLPAVHGMPEAAEHVRELFQQLAERAHVRPGATTGLAMRLNGVSVGGQAVTSSVMPWADEHLGQAVADALGMPVRVLVTQHVTPEYRKLPEPPARSMCLLRAADGVSAHMVDSGQALSGRHSLAGELGHITAEPQGTLCGCGRRGCLETICSGPAICRRALEDLRNGRVESELRAADFESLAPRVAMERIWQAWERGDTFAHATMDPVFDKLAWGLGLVVNLFDPDVIVAGGYVLHDRPAWVTEVERRAQRWILHAARRRTTLTPAQATIEDELRVAACGFHPHAIAAEPMMPQRADASASRKPSRARKGRSAAQRRDDTREEMLPTDVPNA